MDFSLLQDIVVILGLSVMVILLFQKLKLPSILGFLVTGALAGPSGLSLIRGTHEVEVLAEIGVILLLFVIGLEFSVRSLRAIQRLAFLGGGFQVLITIGVVLAILILSGMAFPKALFVGFLISLSSTAIVLKIVQERGEMNSPHGKIILAILIFQDIIVVPMMLLTPIIAGNTEEAGTTIIFLLGRIVILVLVVVIAAKFLVPKFLDQVARTRSNEAFILSVVALCFSVALLSSYAGLSLALGAFLAGLIIAESDYKHQAVSNILPFREIFTSFFFVSIGMLLDLTFLFSNFFPILGLTVSVLLIKASIAGMSVVILKFPIRTTIIVAFTLFQIGEFAFILANSGLPYNLLDKESYQYFLSVSILTMGITPFMIKYGAYVSDRIQPSESIAKGNEHSSLVAPMEDHLIIIGFGVNGKIVSKAAKKAGIPYSIVELNPITVRREKRNAEPIVFGDATNQFILEHVYVQAARVVVVAISDPQATKKIVANIRSLSSKPYLIVRTKFIQEMEENFKLGANEVIPEELETSIEIFTRVLNKYLTPADEIESFVQEIRADDYEMLRPSKLSPPKKNITIDIPDIDISVLVVRQKGGEVEGKTIKEAAIRKLYGVTILAIKRENQYIVEVNPETVVLYQDTLYVFGNPKNIIIFNEKIS